MRLDDERWIPGIMTYHVSYFDVKRAYEQNGVKYTIDAFIYECGQCRTEVDIALVEFMHWRYPQEVLDTTNNIIKKLTGAK